MLVSRKECVNAGAVTLRDVAPVRVAELAAAAASYSRHDIAPVIRALYPELLHRLGIAGAHPAGGLVIAYYEDPPVPSDAVIVHVAAPVAAASRPGCGFAVVELPGIRRAATIIHRGPTEQVTRSLWLLAGWIEDNGYRAVGYHRELYRGHLACEGGEDVIELQVSIAGDDDLQARGIAMHVLC